MTYDFPQHTSGDTFQGVQFEVLINGSPLDLTGATIVMQCKSKSGPMIDGQGQSTLIEFNTTNNHLEIIDAIGGKFTFKKQVVTLAEKTYLYVIKITQQDGDIHTYISGIWKIVDPL